MESGVMNEKTILIPVAGLLFLLVWCIGCINEWNWALELSQSLNMVNRRIFG
jgi:hypothetical protein